MPPPPLRKKLDNKRKMALKGALINYALKRNAGQGSNVKCISPYLSKIMLNYIKYDNGVTL